MSYLRPGNRCHPWQALLVFLINSLLALLANVSHAADFLEPAQAFRPAVRLLDAQTLEIRFAIAAGYHLYRDRLSVVAAEPTQIGALALPTGRKVFDDNFQKEVEIYEGQLQLRLPLPPTAGATSLQLNYQGCADAGLCYPPQSRTVTLAAAADGKLSAASLQEEAADEVASPAVASAAPHAETAPDEGQRIEAALKSGSLLSIIAVFLVGGLLLSFTPCVLPMVPILSSIIVGQGPVTRWRSFLLAVSYSLGMALVYTAFGVVAGLLGEGLAAALQNPWVLGAFALLLVGLSLSMFGVYQLQMPGFIQSKVNDAAGSLPGGKMVGVFVMGGLSALIVGPCVAAPLAGALVFISQTKNVVIGGVALFSLACGMSVPLLLVGLSAGSLLPRAGVWMEKVKSCFGVMLLAVALWLVSPVLPGRVLMLIIGAALMVGAVYLRLLDALPPGASGWQRFGKGMALLVALLGVTQVIGALSGGEQPLQPLQHLLAARSGSMTPQTSALAFRRVKTLQELQRVVAEAGKPVMLDVYADWCVACKELEHLTFRHAKVQPHLQNMTLVQADVTANSAEDKALLKHFGLFGPPGVIFFNAHGSEVVPARVIGFKPAEEFLAGLQRQRLLP